MSAILFHHLVDMCKKKDYHQDVRDDFAKNARGLTAFLTEECSKLILAQGEELKGHFKEIKDGFKFVFQYIVSGDKAQYADYSSFIHKDDGKKTLAVTDKKSYFDLFFIDVQPSNDLLMFREELIRFRTIYLCKYSQSKIIKKMDSKFTDLSLFKYLGLQTFWVYTESTQEKRSLEGASVCDILCRVTTWFDQDLGEAKGEAIELLYLIELDLIELENGHGSTVDLIDNIRRLRALEPDWLTDNNCIPLEACLCWQEDCFFEAVEWEDLSPEKAAVLHKKVEKANKFLSTHVSSKCSYKERIQKLGNNALNEALESKAASLPKQSIDRFVLATFSTQIDVLSDAEVAFAPAENHASLREFFAEKGCTIEILDLRKLRGLMQLYQAATTFFYDFASQKKLDRKSEPRIYKYVHSNPVIPGHLSSEPAK